jgi:hypothetical protein
MTTEGEKSRDLSNQPICFKIGLPIGCKGCSSPIDFFKLTREQVLFYVTNGSIPCTKCQRSADLRTAVTQFPVLGVPENIFGLPTWHLTQQIEASSEGSVFTWDVGQSLPHKCVIVNANITPAGNGSFQEMPSLMSRAQSPYHPWSTCFRFYVPAGGPRAISLLLVLKPTELKFPVPIEMALQAVDAFHRGQLGISTVILASSIEASLRPRIGAIYKHRGVRLPRELGFAGVVERARLLFDPTFGPKLQGALVELAKFGRNVAAHGKQTSVSKEQVAGWMVDTAAVFEWSRFAKPSLAASTP